MFRHMAILRFKPDARPQDIAAYFEAFPKLMASQPTIRSWQIGRNQGAGGETHVRKGNFAPNYDVGLTMLFDDPQGYLTYAESQGHQEFFAKYCTPILAERVVVQFQEK
jgi:hypothetical protein